MNEKPGRRDVDHVLHGVMATLLAAGSGAMLLLVIPALFDQHSTVDDLAAFAAGIGTLAVDYLGGRHIWRSWTSVTDGEPE